MSYVMGRGRHAHETYPTRHPTSGGTVPAFAFDQNTNSYLITAGDPATQIASVIINLSAGSRVKIEGMASFDGAVAAGRAVLSTASLPELSGVVGSQSFGTTEDLSFRTCNYLAISDPQPAGPLTIGLNITVTGNSGARIASAGATVLTLTEIPA